MELPNANGSLQDFFLAHPGGHRYTLAAHEHTTLFFARERRPRPRTDWGRPTADVSKASSGAFSTWYPQVIGLETGEGTDTLAGARTCFFMSGTSTCIIEFDYR